MGDTSKYTPGPWELQHEFDDEPSYICAKAATTDDGEIARVAPCENGLANAQLIAAAPDMLRTLHDIDTWLIAPRTDRETLNHFRYLVQTAIRKAEGKA